MNLRERPLEEAKEVIEDIFSTEVPQMTAGKGYVVIRPIDKIVEEVVTKSGIVISSDIKITQVDGEPVKRKRATAPAGIVKVTSDEEAVPVGVIIHYDNMGERAINVHGKIFLAVKIENIICIEPAEVAKDYKEFAKGMIPD